MSSGNSMVVVKGISLYPQHWAVIASYAKDMGYPSLASALRRILDEWVELKTAELDQE